MKCPHCGAQIGLEEKYCPFCGLPNEFARKHQEDMDRYEQEFQQTQSEVYQKTRHFTSLTVPLTVIFVLILLNIVSFVFVAKAGISAPVFKSNRFTAISASTRKI